MQSLVVVVEDDPDIREILVYVLTEQGYTVYAAASYLGLLEQLSLPLAVAPVLQPGLFLLDVNVPGMSGKEFCAWIKANATLRHIPVVLISANVDVIVSDCGADHFIPKPFDVDRLIASVAHYVLK